MVIGDVKALKRAQKELERAAKQDDALLKKIEQGSIRAVKDLVKEQFKKGIGPDGSPNRKRKDGKTALLSERLARGALDARVQGTSIVFFAKASGRLDQALEGHQAGVVFPPRKAGGQWLRFNAKGRLISYSKFLRRTKNAQLGVDTAGYQSFVTSRTSKKGKTSLRFAGSRQQAAEHTVGQRVLPATPIYPNGSTMPTRWTAALDKVAEGVLEAWAKRAEGK